MPKPTSTTALKVNSLWAKFTWVKFTNANVNVNVGKIYKCMQ